MSHFISKWNTKLEDFHYIMNQLDINSPYGKEKKEELQPFMNEESLKQEFHYLTKVIEVLKKKDIKKLEWTLSKLKNISKTIDACLAHHTLDMVDLYEIKIQAIYMNQLKVLNEYLQIPNLEISDCGEIIEILSDGTHEVETFHIYNSYSHTLSDIRKEKRKIEQLYYDCCDDHEKEQLKEKRSHLVVMEQEEELRIRKELSQKLIKKVHLMKTNISHIAHIDLLIAKGKLAIKYDCVKPNMSQNNLSFVEMVNPYTLDYVRSKKHRYKCNNINMKRGATVLTGANMSGKSTVLKTVLVNVLLGQLGFYVFAKEAVIPLFEEFIYLATYEERDEHGLSSFGLEIVHLNDAIEKIKQKKCLVCVDEFARSTNPLEGQKFVKAFIRFVNQYDSLSIVSTHFDGVVSKGMNHYQIKGLKEAVFDPNTHVTIDNIDDYMDYTLLKVSETAQVPKEAYKVSLLLELDEDYKKYLDISYDE